VPDSAFDAGGKTFTLANRFWRYWVDHMQNVAKLRWSKVMAVSRFHCFEIACHPRDASFGIAGL